VNIGANKDSVDRIADYRLGVRAMAAVADYLTVNISSPNTPGLRALQDPAALDDLLSAVMAERGAGGPPRLPEARAGPGAGRRGRHRAGQHRTAGSTG
jgi:dihydroorotate dehydrogenase